MEITVGDFGRDAKKVVLVGKLDIAGAQRIELPMATVSGSNCNVVVDMERRGFHRVDRHPSLGDRCKIDGSKLAQACFVEPESARYERTRRVRPAGNAADCAVGR